MLLIVASQGAEMSDMIVVTVEGIRRRFQSAGERSYPTAWLGLRFYGHRSMASRSGSGDADTGIWMRGMLNVTRETRSRIVAPEI
jgi:hypothetical protein